MYHHRDARQAITLIQTHLIGTKANLYQAKQATYHWRNGLFGQVKVGGGVILDDLAVLGVDALSDAVYLLVDLRPVVVALLASPRNGVLDATWMPGSDASHLAQTLVGFPGQFLGMPTAGHTWKE